MRIAKLADTAAYKSKKDIESGMIGHAYMVISPTVSPETVS